MKKSNWLIHKTAPSGLPQENCKASNFQDIVYDELKEIKAEEWKSK